MGKSNKSPRVAQPNQMATALNSSKSQKHKVMKKNTALLKQAAASTSMSNCKKASPQVLKKDKSLASAKRFEPSAPSMKKSSPPIAPAKQLGKQEQKNKKGSQSFTIAVENISPVTKQQHLDQHFRLFDGRVQWSGFEPGTGGPKDHRQKVARVTFESKEKMDAALRRTHAVDARILILKKHNPELKVNTKKRSLQDETGLSSPPSKKKNLALHQQNEQNQQQQQKQNECKKKQPLQLQHSLCLSNLPVTTTRKLLMDHFSQFGSASVVSLTIPTAVVSYTQADSAASALARKYKINGWRIPMRLAEQKGKAMSGKLPAAGSKSSRSTTAAAGQHYDNSSSDSDSSAGLEHQEDDSDDSDDVEHNNKNDSDDSESDSESEESKRNVIHLDDTDDSDDSDDSDDDESEHIVSNPNSRNVIDSDDESDEDSSDSD